MLRYVRLVERALHRSEGFPRTGYFVLACVWSGRWADFESCSRIGACAFSWFGGEVAFDLKATHYFRGEVAFGLSETTLFEEEVASGLSETILFEEK